MIWGLVMWCEHNYKLVWRCLTIIDPTETIVWGTFSLKERCEPLWSEDKVQIDAVMPALLIPGNIVCLQYLCVWTLWCAAGCLQQEAGVSRLDSGDMKDPQRRNLQMDRKPPSCICSWNPLNETCSQIITRSSILRLLSAPNRMFVTLYLQIFKG